MLLSNTFGYTLERGVLLEPDLALVCARSHVIRRELDLTELDMGCNLFLRSGGCDSGGYY